MLNIQKYDIIKMDKSNTTGYIYRIIICGNLQLKSNVTLKMSETFKNKSKCIIEGKKAFNSLKQRFYIPMRLEIEEDTNELKKCDILSMNYLEAQENKRNTSIGVDQKLIGLLDYVYAPVEIKANPRC